jgi:5-formyltetrahydrofolate cyclo-ligase
MSTSKDDLREQLKKQRIGLSSQQVEEYSKSINDQLTEILNKLSISAMHAYLPIEKQNEISTWPLLKYVWQNFPEVRTATWQKTADGQFQSVYIQPETKYEIDKSGFWQPQNVKPFVRNTKFDLIIVPLLGFDDNGHRLGYGGGYYDRFLKTQEQAQTVGLCYELGHLKTPIPSEAHDFPLKTVITERKVYFYKSN